MTKPKNPGVGRGGNTPLVHGHKRAGKASPEYRTWLGMKRRCYDQKCKAYPNWGGRGIRVCDSWNTSFVAFLADMGLRPSPTHQIDRLDPEKDYGPDNCRWATPQQQGSENRRGLCPVTVLGIDFPTQAAACRHFGVPATRVNERLKRGASVDDAYSTAGRLQYPRPVESYWRKDRRPPVIPQ